MDLFRWVIAAVLVLAPILWYLWREHHDNLPSVLWARLAPTLGLAFTLEPPSLQGTWKGRGVSMSLDGERAIATAKFRPGNRVRLEIGDRAKVEAESGMVVPDRLEFPEDPDFSAAFLVRATPIEFGRLAVDSTLRRRLLSLGSVHLTAVSGRVDIAVPPLRREEQFREVFDLAAAVADSSEQA